MKLTAIDLGRAKPCQYLARNTKNTTHDIRLFCARAAEHVGGEAELAARLGIVPRTVRRYVSGRYPPSQARLDEMGRMIGETPPTIAKRQQVDEDRAAVIAMVKDQIRHAGSGRKLADALGIHRSLVGGWARGEYLPSPDNWQRIKQYAEERQQ